MNDLISTLYDFGDSEVREYISVPDWIEADITLWHVAAIIEGGCASGAYMPAVTYYQARETMGKYGDDVLEYIEERLGELPPPDTGVSWSGMAVHYLSIAVELWANEVAEELVEKVS